jgi:V/A-type H+-transporting ATPase subunit C
MSEFDYGNARLRARKARLLPRRTLEGLAEAGSLQGLLTALTNTVYRQAVEAALVRLTGMDALAEALRHDLVATLGNVRRFFAGRAGELAALTLRRYDLHNVKTVLRGLARHIPANEILASTLPVGDLGLADLTQLAGVADFRMAIDLLATWRTPLAQPLLELRARRPGADVPEMELALDRWHVHSALEVARAANEEGRPLLQALMLEADAANILTALRLIGVPEKAAILRQRFGTEDVTALFVGPGHVPFALLAQVAHQASIAQAVQILAQTPYGALLAQALESYTSSGRLSAFERALAQRQLQHAASLIAHDTLGIGVLLGYVALKTNEVANLRVIAQGLWLGHKPDRIRAELMFVE